jgi:hypothetical protein
MFQVSIKQFWSCSSFAPQVGLGNQGRERVLVQE